MSRRAHPRARVWLELLRLPNLFTVPGDVLVGWALTGLRGSPAPAVCASLCLYAAGLFLNDWRDAAVDARERPARPIPSGRVRRRTVGLVGAALLALGVLLAWGGWHAALALAAAILLYDLLAKDIPGLGVAVMGLCRALNVLLGAACAWPGHALPPLPPELLCAMAFFWAYIVLVSVVARDEAMPGAAPSPTLRWSPFLLTLALAAVFWFLARPSAWPLAAAALLIPILRRRGDVSALVAGLIRFLIPLQLLWLTLAPVSFWLLAALALCWPLAALAGRRVAGS